MAEPAGGRVDRLAVVVAEQRDAVAFEVAVWLLTPTVGGGGAMRRTPTAIGQAIAALAQYRQLDDAWRADDGTAIHATRLR